MGHTGSVFYAVGGRGTGLVVEDQAECSAGECEDAVEGDGRGNA
jgi:hypothetical protein